MAKGIHIFGASGSGVTTLGRHLADRLHVPFFDTDNYFWINTDPPYTTMRHPADRLRLVEFDTRRHDAWVLSGSLCGWGDGLIPRFSLVVFLYLEKMQRLKRLATREQTRFGKRIEEGGDMYVTNREFMNWAETYDTGPITTRSLKRHKHWIQQLDCNVLKIDSSHPTENIADHVLQHINALGIL